ncbi:hypothetical protein K439DRAFT_815837 [Ramaria rubella]|nr:hypothetical protein K439DRAFT_815837 [Ramaria rubella]
MSQIRTRKPSVHIWPQITCNFKKNQLSTCIVPRSAKNSHRSPKLRAPILSHPIPCRRTTTTTTRNTHGFQGTTTASKTLPRTCRSQSAYTQAQGTPQTRASLTSVHSWNQSRYVRTSYVVRRVGSGLGEGSGRCFGTGVSLRACRARGCV